MKRIYRKGALVGKQGNRYKLTTSGFPTLLGLYYKAHKFEESPAETHLFIQLDPTVTPKDAEPLQSLKLEKIEDGEEDEYIVDIRNWRLFEEIWEELRQEDPYKKRDEIHKLFYNILQWLEKYHSRGNKFAFLNYTNIFVRNNQNQSVEILAPHFDYNYICSESRYEDLFSPILLHSLSRGNQNYKRYHDFYPIAIMLWETFDGKQSRQHNRYVNEVSAKHLYKDFIESFLKNDKDFLEKKEAFSKRFDALKNKIPEKNNPKSEHPPEHSWEEIHPSKEEHSSFESKEAEKLENLKESVSSAKTQEEEEQIRYKIARLERANFNLLKEKEEFKKKINHLIYGFGFSLIGILILGILIFIWSGYTLLSFEEIEIYKSTEIQKSIWHNLALLEASPEEVKKRMHNEIEFKENLIYRYLLMLSNLHLLGKETDEKQQKTLKKEIIEDLSLLKEKEELFLAELSNYEIPCKGAKEEIERLLHSFSR